MKRTLSFDVTEDQPPAKMITTEANKKINFPISFSFFDEEEVQHELIVTRSVYERLKEEESNCLFLTLVQTTVPVDAVRVGQEQSILLDYKMNDHCSSLLFAYLDEEMTERSVKSVIIHDFDSAIGMCKYFCLEKLELITRKAWNNQYVSSLGFVGKVSRIVSVDQEEPFSITEGHELNGTFSEYFKIKLSVLLTRFDRLEHHQLIAHFVMTNARHETCAHTISTTLLYSPSFDVTIGQRLGGIVLQASFLGRTVFSQDIDIDLDIVMRLSMRIHQGRFRLVMKSPDNVRVEYEQDSKVKPLFRFICMASSNMSIKL